MFRVVSFSVVVIFSVFFLNGGCSPADPAAVEYRRVALEAERQQANKNRQYLVDLEIVRVCANTQDSFGRFVQRGPNGRLWVSYYASPESWDQVKSVARGVSAKDVC